MTLKNSDHAVLDDALLRQEAMAALMLELDMISSEQAKMYAYSNCKIIRETFDYYDGTNVQKIPYKVRRVWAAESEVKGHYIVTVEAYFEPGETFDYSPPSLTYWGGEADFIPSELANRR